MILNLNNKVAIYVRVSTDEQRNNGYSIDSQLRMLKEYADKNNYNIVGIYNDAGYSGKNLMLPEMQRLLKDIEDGKIDILLAIKTDRLTRERKEISVRTKRELEQMAIEHKHPNKPPYGYTRDPITKHLDIDPVKALIVKDIFNMSVDGISYKLAKK